MIKTSFSFRHAYGSPKEAVQRLKDIGWQDAPLADTTVFGYDEWNNAATEAGLKPIFGATIAVTPSLNAKKPILDGFTFLAKDSIQPINLLVGRATSQFRYVPQLSYEDIRNVEGVFKIAGYKARLDELDPGDENLFIGLSVATPKGFIREAQKRGFRFIAHQENRYATEDQRYDYETACGRGSSLQTYPQHILSDDEWRAAMDAKELGDLTWIALRNRMVVFDNCNAALPKGTLIKPHREKSLRQMCEEGAAKIGVDLGNPVYNERLTMELQVIEEKGFSDYFYLLGDLMQFCRSEMLCGAGRGSSAGSLLCYLLGITQIDPIKYNLLFWRFIDPNRPDMPDIDSDVPDTERKSGIIWDYLKEKYGKENFAQLGAVGTFQAKNSMRETGKAMGISPFETNPVVSTVTKFAAGDERKDRALQDVFEGTATGKAFIAKHPEMEVAGRLGGRPSHASTHASAVVVTQDPVSNYVAVDARTGTAQIEGTVAEKRGLLKLDVLGLLSLSIFQDTLKLAGLPVDYLSTIPLDDPAAFEVLNSGRHVGLFQFSGRALSNLTKEVTVTSFDDIAALSSLARPGPLDSGAAAAWARRKNGKEEVTYAHELLKPYLSATYGIMCYQEQLMLIAREVAGLDWKDVAALRKAVGKSLGPEAMRAYGEPFKAGLVKAGFTQELADKFWVEVLGYSKYSFNASHAVAYGVTSYWSCWLKAHYPLEFAAAALTHQDDTEKQIALLRELAQEGIEFVPVHPELSDLAWKVGWVDGKKKLIGPVTSVRGLGPKMAQSIASARARNEPLSDRAQKLLSNPKTDLDDLWPIKTAIESIDLVAKGITTKPTRCVDAVPNGDWQEDIVVVGVANVIKKRSENEVERQNDRVERGQERLKPEPADFVEIRLADDTAGVYAKIGIKDYAALAPKVLDLAQGKVILAVKGTICPEAPVMLAKQIRVIGEMK